MRAGVYIGIDGGGSRTRVFLLDAATERSIMLTGGPTNPTTVSRRTGLARILALARAGLRHTGGSRHGVLAISAAIAGYDHKERADWLSGRLASRFPAAKIEVTNDALAALAAGTCGKPGVALIAGTGSIAVGEDARGTYARAGGLGYLIGDEGSGFDIGRRALLAAVQYFEGRGPETRLLDVALHFFGTEHPRMLVPALYDGAHPVGRVAGFAAHVLRAADDDEVARAIVTYASRMHVELVESVHRRLTSRVETVVLGGGLYQQPSLLERKTIAGLQGWQIVRPRAGGSSGALLRAIRLGSGGRFVSDGDIRLWRRVATAVGPAAR